MHIIIDFECLIREGDQLAFIGRPWDGRHVAADRCNTGEADQKDWDMLEGLPVFDRAEVEQDALTVR